MRQQVPAHVRASTFILVGVPVLTVLFGNLFTTYTHILFGNRSYSSNMFLYTYVINLLNGKCK